MSVMPKASSIFPTWKTIWTGYYTENSYLWDVIQLSGSNNNNWAPDLNRSIQEILPKVVLSEHKKPINLARVTPAMLGISHGAPRQDMYDAAIAKGLQLATAEISILTRMDYKNQPWGETLEVAMEPLLDSSGSSKIFCIVCNDGDRWLILQDSHYGVSDYHPLIFVIP